MYKIILGAMVACCLSSGDAWARGGGGGGGGHASGGHAGGRGGVGGYGGYGYGRGGVGIGIGVGLYPGYGFGFPAYAPYAYAPAYPYPYPSPSPYPDPNEYYPYPQDGPMKPMPAPTFAGYGARPGPYATYANPAPDGTMAPVQLEVMLPDADAQVWVEGVLTKTRGRDRVFMTSPLEKGYAYTYTVRAVWQQGGQQVAEERQIQVIPGSAKSIDFTVPNLPIPAQTVVPDLPPPTFDP